MTTPDYGTPPTEPRDPRPRRGEPVDAPPGRTAKDVRGAYAYPVAPRPRTSGLAIASLVTSICGFWACGVGGAIGMVLGIVALRQIRRDALRGQGLAVAGVIIGCVSIVLTVLGVAFLFSFVSALGDPS